MVFCRENLAAEKRITLARESDAYEKGREDATRAIMEGRVIPQPATIPVANSYNPAQPSVGILLTGQGNGRDTATSVDDASGAELGSHLADVA